MTIHQDNGYIDKADNNRYIPLTTDEWGDLTTWADWTSYMNNPPAYLYLTLRPLDLGQVETVNVLSNIQARGPVHYYLYYNNTADFEDSPLNYSTLHIAPGDDNIPSITARYIWIKLAIEYDASIGFPYFDSINYRVSNEETSLSFSNINSSTLSGDVTARTFSIGSNIGAVKNVQITSHGPTNPYNVDLYVSKNQTSSKTFPDIISKTNSAITLAFVGIDGEPRESVFDIQLTVAPEWYIDENGNLQER